MVLQKRLDYSFNGYRVPTMPRATRSARRRGRIRKRVEEDNQVVAFDLLAKVAGKLLEKESPLTSRDTSTEKINSAVMKKEWQDDLSSQDLQYPSSEFVREVHNQYIQNNSSKESFHHYDGEYKIMVKDELHKTGKILNDDNGVDMFDDLDDPDDSSGKVTSCRDHIPQSSYPACRNDIKKVVSRDDDEKSSGCTHQSNSVKSFRQVPHFGDCRMRRILTSKFWKVAPKYSAETITNTDGCDLMPTDHNKSSYKRQRSQMHIPFKKRKFFHCSSISNTDGRNIDRTPDTCKKDASGIGTSSLGSGCQTSFQSRDSHVKLRIKSFKVPELFIEISETATIGSLKRTVMEAVNAILGCGLQVGVILQGKKVRDNSKTLFQTGISCDSQLESLGFSLEPNPSQTPEPLYHAHSSPFLFPSDAPELLSRCPAYPNVDNLASSNLLCVPHMGDFENLIESDHDSAPSPTNVSVEKSTTNSKALIAVDAMPMEPLSVVPAHQKSKRSEIVQRRIRRPFSVAEVEALVQAVEKLGTGRWRDVKLRAFDNAKHRTYVDLKDKWKTLVHTARISPHQRRGEPVPQELLDRVLTANAYWSQQQAKHQLKHQSESETSLLRAS